MDLEDLFRAYQRDVYIYFLRVSGNASEAEELAQDTFVRACGAAVRFRGDRVPELGCSGSLGEYGSRVFAFGAGASQRPWIRRAVTRSASWSQSVSTSSVPSPPSRWRTETC